MALDSGEPFGLPRGTVRGTIALAFTGAFIYMGVVGQIDVITLVALGGPSIGSYFATRAGDAPAAPVEPLAAPSVAGGDAE